MRPLVILRPQPGASATAAAARELGLEPVFVPLFSVEPVSWEAPHPAGFDVLLLTSANAVRHGGLELGKLRGLPVYAVGEATAAEARDAGFSVAAIGEGGIDELLQRIDPGLRLLHVGGEHRREPTAPRQSITHVPVYRSADLPMVDGIARISGAVVAVHSPRAAARLSELAAREGIDIGRTAVAAISAESARDAGGGWQEVAVADRPADPALLALAAALCKKPA